ncbi:carbohydrate ABC transporter permease [Alicyclobacillus sp. SO9]|uniref:carbohydrate ABC transporter permease n=1 Tax=Alicyclobacillus sp. SO9 TaxID=2665646 RepID=UPI0018E87D4F|nr:carbohydrate ABC transporter permease [Alicyclobacillus sp. SO9]QQE77911.1 carbohydrate ABC transporter permease [Alicyclobacillus sp. SO9]
MRTANARVRLILRHVVLIIVSFLMIYPILWMFFASFKPDSQIFSNSSLWPATWTFAHYIDGLTGKAGMNFGPMFLHSFEISLIVVIGSLFSSALTGFAFARLDFTLRRFLFGFMLGTLMLPIQVLLIPQYIIFHKLSLINTFIPLTLPSFLGVNAFFIYLMVQFIRGIPKDLDEAATIDGCGTFRLFVSVILPLTRPALITISIFAFYWTWNDFFGQMIYLSNPHMFTVPIGLNMFLDNLGNSQWGDLFAMSIVSVIPVFLIFVFFQRYLVEGITTQGLKG